MAAYRHASFVGFVCNNRGLPHTNQPAHQPGYTLPALPSSSSSTSNDSTATITASVNVTPGTHPAITTAPASMAVMEAATQPAEASLMVLQSTTIVPRAREGYYGRSPGAFAMLGNRGSKMKSVDDHDDYEHIAEDSVVRHRTYYERLVEDSVMRDHAYYERPAEDSLTEKQQSDPARLPSPDVPSIKEEDDDQGPPNTQNKPPFPEDVTMIRQLDTAFCRRCP